MGEARIFQDHRLLKESICKMDCLFLPADIMQGFKCYFLTSDEDLNLSPRLESISEV